MDFCGIFIYLASFGGVGNQKNHGQFPGRFGHAFIEKLEGAVFPSTLRSLKFGDNFNQMLGVLGFLLTGWGVFTGLR